MTKYSYMVVELTEHKVIQTLKKTINLIQFFILFIWQLPQNIAGLICFLIMGNCKLKMYRNLTLCFSSNRVVRPMLLGNFAFFPKTHVRNTNVSDLMILGHGKLSRLFGPLYFPLIWLPSKLSDQSDDQCLYSGSLNRTLISSLGLELVYPKKCKCYIRSVGNKK